jgi:hypothetical protein
VHIALHPVDLEIPTSDKLLLAFFSKNTGRKTP